MNDGSGKLPAYRGLVDAVKSIVRSNGVKGLYQVQLKYDVVYFRVSCHFILKEQSKTKTH